MALENQLSRYGSITKAIPNLAPGAKLFLVSDSDDTTVGPLNLGSEFPVDKDGVSRVYTTIQAAVNAASAGRGDVVLVLPGYDQSLTAADTWATAGVQVIGMGTGNGRPTLRYTGTAGQVILGASNISVENLRFLAAVDSCVRAVNMDTGHSGQSIKNCKFDFNATGNDFRVMVRAGARRSVIEGNDFCAEDTAGAGRAISIVGGDPTQLLIKDNFIFGQFDTVGDTTNGAAPIAVDSTNLSNATLSGLRIRGNTVINTDTAAAVNLRVGVGGLTVRGLACDNYFANFDSTAADSDKFVTGNGVGVGLRMINNFYNGDSSTEKRVGDTVVVLS